VNAVIDSLSTALALGLIIPWLVISLPAGAALAFRRGWNPGFGVLLGFVPIFGWLLIYGLTSNRARQAGASAVAHLDELATTTDQRGSDW
jgi:hypothetical protein